MSELDDESKIRRKAAVDNITRRKELADVAWILSTVEGRRFFWRMMRRCGINKSSFTGNNSTFFNEGERNIGLIMMADLEEADPEAYLKMLRESKMEESKHG